MSKPAPRVSAEVLNVNLIERSPSQQQPRDQSPTRDEPPHCDNNEHNVDVRASVLHLATFKPFTKNSYVRLLEREKILNENKKLREQTAHVAHLVDGELKFGVEEEDTLPPPNPNLLEGCLFTKANGRIPPRLLGWPIEEIDPGITEKTFVIIAKRFKKQFIHRFTATSSLFIFTPWNPFRRLMCHIATNQFFDLFIFLTIITNCVFLAMPEEPISEKIEYLFLAIYVIECLIKVFARGFFIHDYTYLRDPWNWLDFVVINTAFITIFLTVANPNSNVGNMQGLRTFRVLRALKTVSIVPGLKTIVNALLRAFKMLFEVILLTMFCLMVFALFGLQVYMGVLRQKCVSEATGYTTNPSKSWDQYYAEWIRDSGNWYSVDGDYKICGNATGAGSCPSNYSCLPHVGENPRYGYLNFDHFGWSLLACFQLITLDFWEDVYNKVILATGPWNVMYFLVVIFFGSFYLINLMLAVVSMSYEVEAVTAGKEKEREKSENAKNKHNVMSGVAAMSIAASKKAHEIKARHATDSADDVRVVKDAKTLVILNNADSNSELPSIPRNSTMDKSKALSFKKSVMNAVSLKKETDEKVKKITDGTYEPIYIDGVCIIPADTLLDPETVPMQGEVIDRNPKCCQKVCCKYVHFLKLQNAFFTFVSDPLFDLFITFCIFLNTVFMSLEHHGQSSELKMTLIVSNYIFTGVFILEAFCKIMGLGKFYFYTGWNIFDLIIVFASILDMGLEQVDGLSILRTFRLLRVFKLAQSWPTMRLLLTIIVNTLGALANLCIILGIVIYIFAVIGLQLFRLEYTSQNFDGEGVPRWHFKDFYHSMLMVFRVLCGEWIEPLYDCMRAKNELCMVVFLPALVFGNFIVLNLFLALLLNAFANDSLGRSKESGNDRLKLLQGIDRLKQIFCCCCPRVFRGKVEPSTPEGEKETEGEDQKNIEQKDETNKDSNSSNNTAISPTKKDKETIVKDNGKSPDKSNNATNNNVDSKAFETSDKRIRFSSFKTAMESNNTKSATFQSSEDVPSDKSSEMDETSKEEDDGLPPNCFPASCTSRMKFLPNYNESDGGLCFFKFRCFVKKIIDHKAFETLILLIILGSSLTLAFEDVYLYEKPDLENALYICNIIFMVLFIIEMLLKMVGLGLTTYFTSFWTILDFLIVCISILSLIGDSIGLSNITAFRSLRTLRALRPLRAISRWQGMKIVVNALMNAIPAIMNVFLVCMVFWLIFSIMGVQFFAGKFFKCKNSTTGEVFTATVVPNKAACLNINMTWENSHVTFDNAGIGFLALFQVATFEGWMEVMSDAVDSTDVDQQPEYENNKYAYLYFVVFIVFGAFFSLNLFIGVIIDNFNVLKKKYEGSYLDAFLTQSQKNYYNTLKKLGKKKPQKTIKRPKNEFQCFFYNLAMSNKFELSIVVLIFLNMIVMAIEHYREPDRVKQGLEMMNIIFTTIFILEAIVKIIGLRHHYFRFMWNIFDFIIVIVSLLGIILHDVLQGVFVTPTLLRVIRVFRIGRVLRLIKAAKGIRKLLFALIISLPAIVNIGALLFLVMFMYAIIGMSSFGNIIINGVLDEISNFQTFGNSFMLLLRLATSAGWNDVLDALLVEEPYCNPSQYERPDGTWVDSPTGNCGIPYLAIPFMVSYIVIVWLIVINMYIAVILENFNQAHEQEELGITEDDFDMFYVVWEKYDPHATQFIRYEQLADFVNDLEEPLQIPKPNEIALVSFNLPIMEGEKMHCLDILIALVKNVLAEVEESNEMNLLKEQMESKFAQNFPQRVNIAVKSSTLQRKKEDVAARTLQRAWKSFKAQKAIRNITALAVEQKMRRASATGMRQRTDFMRTLSHRLTKALNAFFLNRRASISQSPVPQRSDSLTSVKDSNCSSNQISRQPKLGNQLKVPQVFTLYSPSGEKTKSESLEL